MALMGDGTATPPPGPTTVDNTGYGDFFLVSGQSNAVGYHQDGTDSLAPLPSAFRLEEPKIQVWRVPGGIPTASGEGFENYLIPNAEGKNVPNLASPGRYGWGVEASMMQSLKDYYLNPVYLGKSASGGKDITWWHTSSNDWLELYNFILKGCLSLVSVGLTPRPRFIWLQGESDAINMVTQAYYEGEMRDLISRLRAINSYTTNMPIIMVKLPPTFYAYTTYGERINAAFTAIAADTANCYTFDPNTISGLTQYDATHYSPQSYLDLGEGLFNLMQTETII